MPPSADSWLRDSWQVLHEGLGGSFWHVLFVRWCSIEQRRWSICGGIMLGWVGSPPRRYREDTWPQVVVHLKPPPCTQQVFRNRFHPTTGEREICVAIWKTCPERASYFKKVCLCFPSFFPDSEQLNLDKYRFGMLQVFLFKTSSL